MLFWFAVGVGLLVVIVYGARWFIRLPPHDLARFVRTFSAVAATLAGTGLIATGRAGLVLIVGGAALLAWLALRRSRRQPDPIGPAASSGPASEVTTDLLAMRLDHASGELTGEVRRGPHAGRPLASLGQSDLLELLDQARRDDPPSVPLLETWLDRHHVDWRARAHAAGAPAEAPSDAMDEGTALEILGLPRGADAAAVKAAHRRLMSRLHPDHGGSDWLASRINAARDFLLGSQG
ncbi:MAG: hypothetical protein U1E14_13945 [Geminicoccaceae bacterium]